MGTAGFGAELEHNLPILDGGLRPDGLGRDEGLMASAGFGVEAAVMTGCMLSGSDGVEELTGGDDASSGGTDS